MKNTPKQVYNYIESLDEQTREFILSRMESDQKGETIKPLDGGGCNAGNCSGHTGCNPNGLVNYYCTCSGGVCVAIPIL